MATAAVLPLKRDSPALVDTAPRKRFKASELPLSSTQRSAIEGLLHTFKKKGEFDALRKGIYSQYDTSPGKDALKGSLVELADAELESNPTLLSKDRRQAAPLIEGKVERSNIYRLAEENIDRLIDEHVAVSVTKFQDIRRAEIGEEAFAEEQNRCSKTNDQYTTESDVRRKEYAEVRNTELARLRELDLEEQRKLDVERRRLREEEEVNKRERLAVEEKRRQEHELEIEKQKEKQREREEYIALKKRQDEEWKREEEQKYEKERQKREKAKERDIDDLALEELIREGQQAAARSKALEIESPRRGIELERSRAKPSALEAIMQKEKMALELQNQRVSSRRRSRSPSRVSHEGFEYRERRSSQSSNLRPLDRHTTKMDHHRDDYRDERRDRRSSEHRHVSLRGGERRSRSPPPRVSRRHERSPPPRRPSAREHRSKSRSRDRGPAAIDRYMPSTSSRAKRSEPTRARIYDRAKEDEGGHDNERGEREHERKRSRDHESERDPERTRIRHSERDREPDRSSRARPPYKEREKKEPVQIDRYVPGRSDDTDGNKRRRRSRSR